MIKNKEERGFFNKESYTKSMESFSKKLKDIVNEDNKESREVMANELFTEYENLCIKYDEIQKFARFSY